MIETIIPGNRGRLGIMKAIYTNPGIHLTALVHKVRASPNFVLSLVNKLCSLGIVKEEKIGGKKKVHLRRFTASFESEISRTIFSLVEMDAKIIFFEKYSSLRTFFLQFPELNSCVLVYGSYARFSAEQSSDLDLIIIGKLTKEQMQRIKEIFVTLPMELSLKVETAAGFLKNRNKPLYQSILKEHVVVAGTEKFMELNRQLYK